MSKKDQNETDDYKDFERKNKKKIGFKRIFFLWLIGFASFVFIIWLMDDITVKNWATAILFMATLALVNTFIRPLLLRITLPITILTFGIFSLIINAFLIGVVAAIFPGIEIASFGAAIWLSVGMSLIIALFHALFAIDDVELYETYVLRGKKRSQKQVKTDKPGVVFVEIDGLSHPVAQRAVFNGYMPHFAKLLRTSHQMVGWECDFASSTPASQAGLILGNNKNMPAFRWYDRKKKKVVTLGDFRDTVAVDKEQSKGIPGLLSKGGASINNMFDGGASSYILTSSKLVEKGGVRKQSGLYYFFANPYNFIRVFFLYWVDIYQEVKDRAYQSRQDVWPRLPFHISYPFIRAVTTIFMREMGISAVIGKMMEGVPSMYATMLAYDEIAHHSGVERSQAMYMLQQLDKQFAKVLKATEYSPRPYHVVFLSDHGQSQGATFLQRYGFTLEDHIELLVAEGYQVQGSGNTDESWDRINAILTDAAGTEGDVTSKIIKSATKSKTKDGSVVVGPSDSEQKTVDDIKTGEKSIIVLASGNLGLVYFTEFAKRLTLEQMEKKFPKLIPGLVEHQGVGFIMVKSKKGSLVIGDKGVYNLDTDKLTGEDPLKDFSPNTAMHLKRESKFKHLPDILVNSFYDSGTDEICAYEELIGAHGGIGGNQNKPFLMYPKELEPKKLEGMTSTHDVHKVLKKWAFAAA